MKIGGSPRPPVLPAWQPEPAHRPAGDPRGETSTFGFDELGVFGLRQGQDLARAPKQDRMPRSEDPLPPPAGPLDERQQPAAALAPAPAGPRPLTPPPPRPGHSLPAIDPAADRNPAPELRSNESGTSGALVEAGPAGAPDASPAEESAVRPPRPHAASRTGHQLVVSVNDGRVSIAVGSPPLDGEGRALLRKLVREILAGRRLGLADFQLNGVPLGADFLDMTGGSHGPCPR
jgi:hypothetical protein